MKNLYLPLEVKELSKLLALPYTGESYPNYWKANQLIEFFNNLGFGDDYDFVHGKGILTKDLPENVSRSVYTLERLKQLNNQYRLSEAIHLYADSVDYPLQAIEDVAKNFKSNKRLQQELIDALKQRANKDNLRQIEESANKTDTTSESKDMEGSISLPLDIFMGNNAGPDLSESKIETKVNSEEEKSPFAIYKTQFERIKKGHPTVFISYAWENDETLSKWVKKLADDLIAKKGINVLLDQYNPKGVNLVEFMNDAIRCADRVLIIGTPKYKEKAEKYKDTGAHYEDQIINQAIYQNKGACKFIPCLRKGTFATSFTPYVATNVGYDFRNDESYSDLLNDLAKEIWCKSDHTPPEICENPEL